MEIVAPIVRLRIFLMHCFFFNNRHINPGPYDIAIGILEHASCLLPTPKQSGLHCDFTVHKHHPLCLMQQHTTALHTQRCLALQQQNTSTWLLHHITRSNPFIPHLNSTLWWFVNTHHSHFAPSAQPFQQSAHNLPASINSSQSNIPNGKVTNAFYAHHDHLLRTQSSFWALFFLLSGDHLRDREKRWWQCHFDSLKTNLLNHPSALHLSHGIIMKLKPLCSICAPLMVFFQRQFIL